MRYTYDFQGKYTGTTTDNPPPFRSTDKKPPQPYEGHYVVFVDGNWIQIPIPVHVPTNEEVIEQLTKALEDHYDQVARLKRYDDRYTCAIRAGYEGPFQEEGITFARWMDTCNAYAYGVMYACLEGEREIPTAEELIAELPKPCWCNEEIEEETIEIDG